MANKRLATIPHDLCERPQWVTWKYIDGRKVPFNGRTGQAAKSNDPATWATFDEACQAAQHRHHAGIGYVLSADDPFVGIDLDDCIQDDNTIAPIAAAIIDTMHTYSEISPSGKGVKLWVRGTIPASVAAKPIGDGVKIEMYSTGRFFTVTGNQLGDTPAEIRTADDELRQLYERVQPAPTRKQEQPGPLPMPRADDDHLRRYVLGALEHAREHVMAAGDGERHCTRRNQAYGLAGYLHTGTITEEDIFNAVAVNFGPDQKGAERTIWDAIAAGQERPRPIPEPRQEPSGLTTAYGTRYPANASSTGDTLDTLDADTLRQRLRTVIAERDGWQRRAEQLEAELEQVRARNRFDTQAHGAPGIATPSMRLTFIELKKELDRVPVEERAPDQWIPIRPAYMATCSNQNPSSISHHLSAFVDAELIEKKVERIYDPATDTWRSATFVRPLVDLSDPSKVVIPSKPRGKQACKKCESERLVREIKVYCADCGHVQSQGVDLVNPPEPEMQTANQDDGIRDDTVDCFDQPPEPASDVALESDLNCTTPSIKTRATVGVCELQSANQDVQLLPPPQQPLTDNHDSASASPELVRTTIIGPPGVAAPLSSWLPVFDPETPPGVQRGPMAEEDSCAYQPADASAGGGGLL